tara:strand:+ start:4689 stop:5960 length:1272 start_codon:yes stop_codon:yes gene_type:complete
MPRVRASFAWVGEPNSEGYHIFHESTQIADVTGISYERELDLPYGAHRFSIRGYNAGGHAPFASTVVELLEPMPEPPGTVEGFNVTLTLIGTTPPPAPGSLYDLETIRSTSGARTPPTWATDGSFSWPNEPVTTQSETVTTMAELQAALQVSGNQITIPASFGTQTGLIDITSSVSDIDVIMSNSATINHDGFRLNGTRMRWTGGNVIGTAGNQLDIGGTDIIMDDMVAESNTDEGSFNSAVRLAILNSTISQDGAGSAGGWAMFNMPNHTQTDWILANTRVESSGQNNRFQNVKRLIIIDSVLNPDGVSANSLRMHDDTDYVWLADTEIGYKGILSYAEPGYTYGFNHATWERVVYHSHLPALLINSTNANSTAEDCLVKTTDTGDLSGAPGLDGMTDLGGNTMEFWDGTTYPDYSAIGAQR